jgi:murein L,D-transpeptidase YcbB/YkuD
MKSRVIFAAAFFALASLPTMNWAQEPEADSAEFGQDRFETKRDDGENPFAAKQLEEHKLQLKIQEKQLRKQADEMRKHGEFAAKEAHKQAELAQIKFRSVFRGPGNPRFMNEINEQAAKYRDADNEEEKSTALKNLNQVVDKCFEDDMKVREQELASIEERLNKLRAQLDRRRAKKQEIVDLQVKVVINDAEGLGFYSESKGDMFKFRVPMPVVTEMARPWEAPATWEQAVPPPFPGAAPGPVPAAAPAPPAPVGTIRIEGRGMEIGPPVPTSVVKLEKSADGELTLVPQPVFDRRPLSLGAEGDLVRLLQFQLNTRLEPSPNLDVDADFGPATEQAVKDFQKQEDLEVTGVVDEATRKELDRRN